MRCVGCTSSFICGLNKEAISKNEDDNFFQYYCPEAAPVYDGRKYGYNLKSQLLKLLVIFPAASTLAAWICTMFQV